MIVKDEELLRIAHINFDSDEDMNTAVKVFTELRDEMQKRIDVLENALLYAAQRQPVPVSSIRRICQSVEATINVYIYPPTRAEITQAVREVNEWLERQETINAQ